MKLAIFAAFAAALPIAALAHDYRAGDIVVDHPYSFATAPSAMSGGGYMSLTNTGAEDDRLIAVEADFPKVMLHLSEEKGGVATMTHVEGIAVPAGETVDLAPGGYHVMFMGLDGDPFEDGEKIPATLVFEKSGQVEVTFNVESRSGDTPPDAHAGH